MITALLYLALVAYSALDIWQTWLLLNLGCVEANPIVAYFIDTMGFWEGTITIKAIVLIPLGIFLYLWEKQRRAKGE